MPNRVMVKWRPCWPNVPWISNILNPSSWSLRLCFILCLEDYTYIRNAEYCNVFCLLLCYLRLPFLLFSFVFPAFLLFLSRFILCFFVFPKSFSFYLLSIFSLSLLTPFPIFHPFISFRVSFSVVLWYLDAFTTVVKKIALPCVRPLVHRRTTERNFIPFNTG